MLSHMNICWCDFIFFFHCAISCIPDFLSLSHSLEKCTITLTMKACKKSVYMPGRERERKIFISSPFFIQFSILSFRFLCAVTTLEKAPRMHEIRSLCCTFTEKLHIHELTRVYFAILLVVAPTVPPVANSLLLKTAF